MRRLVKRKSLYKTKLVIGFDMTPAQSRAGRGLVNMSQAELAEAARVGLSTVRNFEAGRSIPIENNLTAIRAALESAGVEFIAENGGGAGVRLKKPTQTPVEIERKIGEVDVNTKALDGHSAANPRTAVNQRKVLIDNKTLRPEIKRPRSKRTDNP